MAKATRLMRTPGALRFDTDPTDPFAIFLKTRFPDDWHDIKKKPTVNALLAEQRVSLEELFIQSYPQDPWLKKRAHLKELTQNTDGLWIRDKDKRIVVPDVPAVLSALMHDYHDSNVAGHPGRRPTAALIARKFWWHGMGKFIKNYVSTCPSCQKNKPRRTKPGGTLQPLPIPVRPWSSVSMDLITCLPRTRRGHDALIVWVCRLTKMVVVAPTQLTMDAYAFAQLTCDHALSQHGVRAAIFCERS